MRNLWFIPGMYKTSRMRLGPHLASLLMGTVCSLALVKRLRLEAGKSIASFEEVQNAWYYTLIPPYAIVAFTGALPYIYLVLILPRVVKG
jgi:hypothetical protein